MKTIKSRAALLFFVSFYSFFLLPLAPLWAQGLALPPDTDLFAPVIRHEPPVQAVKMDSPLRLKAKVTDNVGVSGVTLFYRTAGEEAFSSLKMESLGMEDYAATVPKERISIPGFEYYIQAGDQAGNTTLRGFSFSPLTLAVSPDPLQEKAPVLTEALFPTERESFALSTGETLEKPWYKKWWVWTIALAVVGGAAVAAGNSGGGDSAGAQTGSVSFTGGTP